MKARIWTPRAPPHTLGPRKARGMGLRMAAAEVDRLRCFCLVFTRNTCWTESGDGLSHESHREEPRWIEPRDAYTIEARWRHILTGSDMQGVRRRRVPHAQPRLAYTIETRWRHILTGSDMQGVRRRRVPHACAGFPSTTASFDIGIISSACQCKQWTVV